MFVYFTADWCLTCKVNEAAAIDRSGLGRPPQVRRHVYAGDWTDGDPASRLHRGQGPRRVPLYLWYEPNGAIAEPPQVLTPGMLISRAHTSASGAFNPLASTQVSRTCVRAKASGSTAAMSRSTRMKSAHFPGSRLPILSSAKLAAAAAKRTALARSSRSAPPSTWWLAVHILPANRSGKSGERIGDPQKSEPKANLAPLRASVKPGIAPVRRFHPRASAIVRSLV